MTQATNLPADFLDSLSTLFGDRLSTSQAVREHHGRDESIFAAMPPDAVVFARSTDEVVSLVKLCSAYRIPLVPYGAGSSLEGNTLAARGGVTLNLQQMDQVLSISADDQTATVQPGVTRKALNALLRDSGLFFPVDPGADATFGGMCATRASGTNAVRYGTMRENVLNLKVVTADGEIVCTGRRARKSAAGYDLTRLFVGSEGTLGVIVEATVKLYALPESISAAVCAFPDIDAAVRSVVQTIQMGVPIARCEFVESMAIRAINQHSKTGLPEQPHLFFEFHGSETGVREQIELVQELCSENGGAQFQWASSPEERSKLWEARHNVYFAALQLRPGSRAIVTDVCVPISELAACVTETAAPHQAPVHVATQTHPRLSSPAAARPRAVTSIPSLGSGGNTAEPVMARATITYTQGLPTQASSSPSTQPILSVRAGVPSRRLSLYLPFVVCRVGLGGMTLGLLMLGLIAA